MRLAELLLELGNSSYSYDISYSDSRHMQIDAADGRLVVNLMVDNNNELTIDFAVNGKYSVTGTGDAIRIFSTVKHILETELCEMITPKIHTVGFAADKSEPSRVRLYNRIIPVITKILGHQWINVDDNNDDNSLYFYTWKRK